jgi:colanic acid/amylovoran biosynthesis protein
VNKPPHFLLVGNGPYSNRGCEAIVRGTMAILRRSFGEQITATVASFADAAEIARQAAAETDPALTHVCLSPPVRRLSWRWLLLQGYHRLHLRFCNPYPMLAHGGNKRNVALEIGGDNYTLDYGLPAKFLTLDRYLQEQHTPVVLWGASVGPFDEAPEFADAMLAHLRSLDAIYVRESTTIEYLRQREVAANVHEVADPAFALQPVAPQQAVLDQLRPDGAIGLNVSPLMAKYVTSGDSDRWTSLCCAVARRLCEETDHDILLIPHVTADPGNNDHLLLQAISRHLAPDYGDRVRCAPATLSAAETKWLIARCSLFIGARTHATIAALSSLIPTISLVYSNKGRGLNDDLLGTRAYCIEPATITPEGVAACARQALENAQQIRRILAERVPAMAQRAFAAGDLLRQLTLAQGKGSAPKSMDKAGK